MHSIVRNSAVCQRVCLASHAWLAIVVPVWQKGYLGSIVFSLNLVSCYLS